VSPSPGEESKVTQDSLHDDPESLGSLSLALSEAFAYTYGNDDAKFCWGTVMKHVILHHTVIGLEARAQMRQVKAYPHMIMGAVGGGSGLAGLAMPFYRDRRKGTRIVAVETAAAPSLSKGKYRYDYADAAGMSALYKMYTLGRSFVPPGIRAGGMRYHGLSPIVSALYQEGEIEARTHTQRQALEAAVSFARAEGLVPSPESAYTIRAVMDEAISCKEARERKDILFMLNANGNLDVATFKDFLEGNVEDQPFLEDAVDQALRGLPEAGDQTASGSA
jgi:predicted alternative tryptophan synthase beta-subunit